MCLFFMGALLLFFSASNEKTDDLANDLLPSDDAKEALETELVSLICSMQNIRRAKVCLTLESGNEYVYENGNNKIVLAGRVRGVAVVCNGGNDPVVKERICNMLCSLLDLPLKSVSVCE